LPLFLKVSLSTIPSQNIKTNLDSYKYVHYPYKAYYNQYQGYEACALVLLLSYCAGESPLGILLVLISCAGLGLGLVIVGLRASVCRGPSGWYLLWPSGWCSGPGGRFLMNSIV
jgi:hypothetical protein